MHNANEIEQLKTRAIDVEAVAKELSNHVATLQRQIEDLKDELTKITAHATDSREQQR